MNESMRYLKTFASSTKSIAELAQEANDWITENLAIVHSCSIALLTIKYYTLIIVYSFERVGIISADEKV